MAQKPGKDRQDSGAQDSLLFRLWSRSRKGGEQAPAQDPPDEAFGEPAEASPVAVQEAAPPAQDPLARLWETWGGGRGRPFPDPIPPGLEEQENEQAYAFLKELSQAAREIMARVSAEPDPFDAEIRVRVVPDGMCAWLFAFPPLSGGEDMTPESLFAALQAAGVVYGFDKEQIADIAREGRYFQMIPAARGQEAVNGKNGEVTDCIPRQTRIEEVRGENGEVSFKNVNEFGNIRKGTVVCRIVPPTEGVDGINVRGEKVRARHGRPADLPRSPNVTLSPDGTELVAAIDGHISFENNKFILEKQLVIDGDVDLSVGNLDFAGDIVISGDVRDGYQVKATGSVTIRGMVEDATVIAGGNITLEKGMNGNGSGSLDAQGEIHSKFLENCVVHSTGSIYAGSIIWSNVFSDDSVYVTSGKGVIIGGTCTACHTVEANGIGSKSNRLTTIVIGNTPSTIARRDNLEREIAAVRDEYAEVVKDMAYLESRPGPMPEERRVLLNKLRLRKPVLLMKENRLKKQLEKLGESMADVSRGRIVCGVLYPFTKVVIGETSMTVEEVYRNCQLRFENEEIVIGFQ